MALIPFPWSDEREHSKKAIRPFDSFQKEMNRLMDTFFGESTILPTTRINQLPEFSPSVDVTEDQNEYLVKAELPGLSEQDIKVNFQDNVLTIEGEKEVEKEDKDKNYRRVECSYGSFYRSIPFSTTVDESKIKARVKNGILKVQLPKSAAVAAKTKSIKIEKE